VQGDAIHLVETLNFYSRAGQRPACFEYTTGYTDSDLVYKRWRDYTGASRVKILVDIGVTP